MRNFYYKNIMLVITSITSDFVTFNWLDTGTSGKAPIPRSSRFPWEKLQIGKAYAVLTRTPNTGEVSTRFWDWVSAYPIDLTGQIGEELDE